MALFEEDRVKLDNIIQQMISSGEADEDIQFVVGDFKSKYGTREEGVSPSSLPPEQENVIIGSPPAGIPPIGTLPSDVGFSQAKDLSEEQKVSSVKDFIAKDRPSQVAEIVGLGGKIGLGIATAPVGLVSLVTNAAMFGGIDALEETIKGVAYGEDVRDAAISGAKRGATTAALDLAFVGTTKVAGKVIKTATKSGKKLIKKRASEKLISDLSVAKDRVKIKSSGVSSKINNRTKEIRNSLQGSIKSADGQIDDLQKNIDEVSAVLQKESTSGVSSVKKQISKEYTDFFKDEASNVFVNIDNELSSIAESLNLKELTGTGKNKLIKILNALKPELVDPKKQSEVSSIIKKISDGNYAIGSTRQSGILLEDAHWLKQVLYEVGGSMKKKPTSQNLGYYISGVAKSLGKNMDNQVGGKYSSLSKAWSDMKGVEDFIESSVGKTRTVLGETKRKGANKISAKLSSALKQGDDFTEDALKEMDDTIASLYHQADLFEKYGQENVASSIRSNIDAMSSAIVKKGNISKARKVLFSLSKNKDNENSVKIMNEIKNIELDSGKKFSDIVSDIHESTRGKIIGDVKKIESLSKAKSKTSLVTEKALSEIEKTQHELKRNVPKKTSMDIIRSSVVASSFIALGVDWRIATMIPTAVVLKGFYPNFSKALYETIESNIAQKAMSETARNGARRALTELSKYVLSE